MQYLLPLHARLTHTHIQFSFRCGGISPFISGVKETSHFATSVVFSEAEYVQNQGNALILHSRQTLPGHVHIKLTHRKLSSHSTLILYKIRHILFSQLKRRNILAIFSGKILPGDNILKEMDNKFCCKGNKETVMKRKIHLKKMSRTRNKRYMGHIAYLRNI